MVESNMRMMMKVVILFLTWYKSYEETDSNRKECDTI